MYICKRRFISSFFWILSRLHYSTEVKGFPRLKVFPDLTFEHNLFLFQTLHTFRCCFSIVKHKTAGLVVHVFTGPTIKLLSSGLCSSGKFKTCVAITHIESVQFLILFADLGSFQQTFPFENDLALSKMKFQLLHFYALS